MRIHDRQDPRHPPAGATSEVPCNGVLLLPGSLEQLPAMLTNLAAIQRQIDVVHVVYSPASSVQRRCPASSVRQGTAYDSATPATGNSSTAVVEHMPSLDETASAAVKACSEILLALGVANVSMLGVAASWDVHRIGYRASGGAYEHAPILSFIEPPTACMLETDTLPPVLQYVPSYAHQLHTFLVQVRPPCSSCLLQQCTLL